MIADVNTTNIWITEFYQNLKTLVDTAFPKKCSKCGKIYPDSHAFLTETTPVKDHNLSDNSGLFSLDGVGNVAAIGVFRNCICGTTLLVDFHDRRDLTDQGNERRTRFDQLLQSLCEHGVEEEEGRAELRKVLRGQESPKMQQWLKEAPVEIPVPDITKQP